MLQSFIGRALTVFIAIRIVGISRGWRLWHSRTHLGPNTANPLSLASLSGFQTGFHQPANGLRDIGQIWLRPAPFVHFTDPRYWGDDIESLRFTLVWIKLGRHPAPAGISREAPHIILWTSCLLSV
jgi:hypothetical protein